MNRSTPAVIEVAVEPRSQGDLERFETALIELCARDPPLGVSMDRESGQVILKGTSEAHLDGIVDMLRRDYKVDMMIGAPQVGYRETIRRGGIIDYTHKKPFGPKSEFARIKIRLVPGEPGSGFIFEPQIAAAAVPAEYIPGVEKGLQSAVASGILAGFPVIDLKVELINGAYHDVDSSPMAFEIAARAAMRECLQKCGSVLLEPIMKVEVTTPEDCAGTVLVDLRSRRGRMLRSTKIADGVLIEAFVGLADMFGYINNLHAMSHGRASFSMAYDHYAAVPSHDDDDPPAAPAVALRR
jgi:elongation factor G